MLQSAEAPWWRIQWYLWHRCRNAGRAVSLPRQGATLQQHLRWLRRGATYVGGETQTRPHEEQRVRRRRPRLRPRQCPQVVQDVRESGVRRDGIKPEQIRYRHDTIVNVVVIAIAIHSIAKIAFVREIATVRLIAGVNRPLVSMSCAFYWRKWFRFKCIWLWTCL